MPRWPAGLHPQSGTQRPRAGMVQGRPRATPQLHYQTRIEVPLHAAATWPPGPVPGLFPSTPLTAWTGPAGVGEQWAVDLVQVQSGTQYGQAPLVVQQIQAQESGVSTSPPPPIVAQVWLRVGGVNVHLLGQTTSGGNDGVDVAGQVVTPGEAIAVVWYNVAQNLTLDLWFVARGTKSVLVAG